MLVWLLDLTIGGRTIYLSSQPVTYAGRMYSGTLDQVSLTESLDGVGQIPSERTASISCLVSDPILAQAIEWGHDFTASRGTLRIWDTDQPEHLAISAMTDARADAPQVGDRFEVVSLTLSSEPLDDSANILDLDERVDFATVYDADITRDDNPMREEPSGVLQTWIDDSPGIGRYYPTVYGSAGSQVFSPAIPFAYNVAGTVSGWVVSGRPVADDGGSNKVRLYRENEGTLELVTGTGSLLSVFQKRDNRGNGIHCLYVDEIGLSGVDPADGWWVAWLDVQGSQAIAAPGGVQTVGDLVVDLAARSGQPWDIPSLRASMSSFGGSVAWFIDEPIAPSEALTEVLDLLPLSFYIGPNGITAIRIDLDPPKRYTVPLVDGLNCHRTGPISMTRKPEEQAAEIVVEYAPNQLDDRSGAKKIKIKPKGDPGAGAFVTPWSMTTSTPDAVQEYRIPWTYDDATAMSVADWLSRRATYTARTVPVQIRSSLALNLPPGTPIRFTDPTVYMSEVVGIVSSRTMTDDPLWDVELSFFPSTSSRATEEPAGGSDDAPPPPPQV